MENKQNDNLDLDLSKYDHYLNDDNDHDHYHNKNTNNIHNQNIQNNSNTKSSQHNNFQNKSPKKSKSHKASKTKKIILTLVLVLLILIILLIATGIIIINNLFNKIDYESNSQLSYNDFVPDIETNDTDSNGIKDDEDELLANFGGTPMSNPHIKNILLIGRDTRNNKSYSRSDVMMLVSINDEKHTIKLSSFQRDIYAYIPGKGYDKLTHAHAYAGPHLTMQTLEGNFHVKIDHYMSVTFSAFRNIVNILGGVDMNLTAAEANYLKPELTHLGYRSFNSGIYHLDGNTALNYCRIRYIDSDRERTQRHRNMINAITDQHQDITLTQAYQLLDQCLPLVKTDFTKSDLMATMVDALSYITWPRSEIVMPIDGASNNATVRGMFVITLDWAKNAKALQEFIYGDD